MVSSNSVFVILYGRHRVVGGLFGTLLLLCSSQVYGINYADPDGDGMFTTWEISHGLNPANPADGSGDPDGDGLINSEEHWHSTNPFQADSDQDWLSDSAELNAYSTNPLSVDTDGDAFDDIHELAIGTDPGSYATDIDSDGMPGYWELANGLNPSDSQDAGYDPDADALSNLDEYLNQTDPQQADSDSDWLNDGKEVLLYKTDPNSADTDSDGRNDIVELSAAEDPTVPDADRDGIDDRWERANGLSTEDAGDAGLDGDGDGLTNLEEFQYQTDPANRDTDGDWLSDGAEINRWGTNPNLADSDMDGRDDLTELYEGTDPLSSPVGLSTRPDNLTCIAPPVNDEPLGVKLEYPYEGAGVDPQNLASITKILMAPNDESRWYVLEQTGLIKVFDVSDPGNVSVWLDFSSVVKTDGEQGMLGMAFDPDFPNTPEIYLSYTVYENPAHPEQGPKSRISRVILDDVDSPQSITEQVLLRLDQNTIYHQGGEINFGADGYLWIGVGEDNRPAEAQKTTSLYGSMLRIDVRGVGYPAPGYLIPDDNAFSLPEGEPAFRCNDYPDNAYNCPEIYAWGFRNPWRWSFDTATGSLWLGDVGVNTWEEVNLIEKGNNYGFGCFEGNRPDPRPGVDCVTSGPFTFPVAEFSHDGNVAAVIGGFVYRGTEIPELVGRYVYADLSSGRVWALQAEQDGGYAPELISHTYGGITSFAEGPGRELYLTRYIPGRIAKLAPLDSAPPLPGEDVATNLVDTGCVDTTDPRKPSAAMVPYDVPAKLWSDGAFKNRAMAIPNGTFVSINAENDFEFPIGSVLYKDFWLDGDIIETRLLMHRPDGDQGRWEGFTYEWNAEQTAATMVEGGKVVDIDGLQWTYPNQAQCNACHTTAAGKVLGPETAQLNSEYLYAETGITANQMLTLDSIDYFDSTIDDLAALPSLPNSFDDADGSLSSRARGYLHSNCSHCHRPGTTVPASIDLRYSIPLQDTITCNELPGSDLGLGIDARIISPGVPEDSVLLERMMQRRGAGGSHDDEQMPPLATTLVHEEGVALIGAWIGGLTGCEE